jgi:hypothetical protein
VSVGRDSVFGAFADQFGIGQNRASAARSNVSPGRSKDSLSATAKSSAKSKAERGSSLATTSAPKGKAGHLEGRLNAAHASANAMAHASLNSTVGQIASYKAAMEAYTATPSQQNLDKAAAALAGVANKGITAQTVTDLNSVLGVSLTDAKVAEQVADKAQEIQSAQGTTKR